MGTPFSVLMSVYKNESALFLKDALYSLINQSCIPTEIVLVEDGPLTDSLYDVISEFRNVYQNLKSVKLPQNIGLGGALNQGLKACTYNLVARMDSDDLCYHDRFEKQIRIFENHPDIKICGGWISEFSDNPNITTGYRKVPERNDDIVKHFRKMSPMNHVTVMFDKAAIQSVDGYQPFFQFEDYWLWARLIKKGYAFYNIPDVLVNVRGGISMSRRRGGLKYVRSEISFQNEIYRLGLIGKSDLLKNLVVRTTVRLMPSRLRVYIYSMIRKYQDKNVD